MKFVTLMSALAAISTVGLVQAQDGPQGGQGGPGGPGGAQMRMRHMPPMGGPGLLLNPNVVAELKLTSDQIEKIEALHPHGMGGEGGTARRSGGGGGEGAPGLPGGDHEQMQKMHEEMQNKLKEILTDGQFKRFKQIELQAMGPMALLHPDISKDLGLSNDQIEKFKAIMKAHHEAMQKNHGPETGDEMPSPKAMEAMHEKLKGEILGVLSEEQKSKWESMLGKPFKLPMMQRIPRGGPDGGPGGRNGRGGPGGASGGPGGPGGGEGGAPGAPGEPGGPPSGGDD